ncbi:hypothetical protein CKALI_00810 [Corynebacterium kalinowskii]|uniref:Uncharacterized protein n=1 Tax=Corynebacterium kalinowskii TaxID=2675216 RepID=A0A6B8V9K9_9CORY|nr:hypothetical protein CKALI_00810 [Corynebacterium kalinowskii]
MWAGFVGDSAGPIGADDSPPGCFGAVFAHDAADLAWAASDGCAYFAVGGHLAGFQLADVVQDGVDKRFAVFIGTG